jgi:hypothetical protein
MDQINNKPESQLPWQSLPSRFDCIKGEYFHDSDEAYILHACNAYPKLISTLKLLNDSSRLGSISMVDDLLKELGEH